MDMEILKRQGFPVKRAPEIVKMMKEQGADEGQTWAAIQVYLMGVIDGKRMEREKKKRK